MIHDEEIPCLTLSEINSIDEVKFRTAIMDNVTKIITAVKDKIVWINEHLGLISHIYFKCNKEKALLLIKNHTYIFELEAFKLALFERHAVELVFGSRLVIMHPHFFRIKDILDLQQVISVL